jgi:HlyD family secretion protein
MADAKKKSKRGLVLIILLVALAGGAAVYFKFYWKVTDFAYAGTLESTKVDLSAQLPSTIADVKVREGDRVTVGQELVTLSCDDFKVASRLANQNFDRNRRLFKLGTVSQDTLDQFQNRKDDTDLRLKWCSISSPIQGTVLSRYHEPGEWTSPGLKLLTLANIRDIWTFIYVPQQEVASLSVGMKLTGIVPEIAGKSFEGTIIKINDEAEFTPKNVQTRSERTRLVFGIKVSFLGSNNEEILKPGMTIEITLPKSKV